MKDLFIPPAGAMQMEIVRHPVPEIQGAQLWVKPITDKPSASLRRQVSCKCETFYQLLQCEPAHLWDGSWTVTCKCFGDIIE